MMKELELYIHIPFCIRKCAYCDFLSGPSDPETIQKYVDALVSEIKATKELASNYVVTTIFFGGGTPSILSGVQMQTIMNAVKSCFELDECAEISMEANPGTVNKENLICYITAGINRISFGLQSTKNEELKVLGRIHTYEEFLGSYTLARECGFTNINVDLISAIPGQTLESWENSLEKIIQIEPEHISAYSLIIEEGTPFAKLYGEGTDGEKELPSEETEREIYRRTEELLRKAGYERYEISNYAKKGKECRHNLGYWERKNYLGLGLGASSLMGNERFRNTSDLSAYIEMADRPWEIREEREMLDRTAQMEEFVFLGMRKMEGISLEEFQQTFGEELMNIYGDNIRRMEEQGLIEKTQNYLKLTKAGIDVSNYVFAEILF